MMEALAVSQSDGKGCVTMPKREQTPEAVRGQGKYNPPPVEPELIPGSASIARSIAPAVVIKDEDLFFLTEPDGCVPLHDVHGFGLYYHDCRFLNGYELRVGGKKPDELVWNDERGFMAVIGLTNPGMIMPDGDPLLKHKIEIKCVRLIDSVHLGLYDLITFHSLAFQPIDLTVSLAFKAAFEDVFSVRGMVQERRGQLGSPTWKNGVLSFIYDGADDIYRSLMIHSLPVPDRVEGATAHYTITLQPKENKQILVSFLVAESADRSEVKEITHPQLNLKRIESSLQRSTNEWLHSDTQIHTDSISLNKIMNRSFHDLRVLRSHVGHQEYFAAGLPWFATLFGRDSIITALQTLAYSPKSAEQTIRLLASYQGRAVNQWREEQPGKILHELRVGEMARLGEIPHTPYYGTIDATPLFLVLIGRHAAWTGDLTLFNELRSNVESALHWMSEYGDLDGDGYIEYVGLSEKGLTNQGWKDSGDGIVNGDGSLVTPPVALVEVQGYVYQAKIMLAELYRRAGEVARAETLQHEADELRAAFNKEFWLDEGFYALALQAEKRPADVMSSNAGHALWAGIADPDKARLTVERLMADDMFNGWGIRTLSETEHCYNPLGYHLGTVWPHDNSLVAAGFKRYGFDYAALRVFVGMVEAAAHFDAYRLPELFAGFRKDDYGVAVRYPVACQPQAWAAGAVPFLLTTLLGLVPEAFENRLRIVRPIFPDFINQVEVHRLRVGAARVDLKFERICDNIEVKVLKLDGRLDVVLER
jgi:glycogen debranching enzyme